MGNRMKVLIAYVIAVLVIILGFLGLVTSGLLLWHYGNVWYEWSLSNLWGVPVPFVFAALFLVKYENFVSSTKP